MKEQVISVVYFPIDKTFHGVKGFFRWFWTRKTRPQIKTVKQKAVLLTEKNGVLRFHSEKVAIPINVKPNYFVKRRKILNVYYQGSNGDIFNLYDGSDNVGEPMITPIDTSDFDAIQSVTNTLKLSGVFKAFWVGVYKLNDDMGKWDLLILAGFTLGVLFIIEFFANGGF